VPPVANTHTLRSLLLATLPDHERPLVRECDHQAALPELSNCATGSPCGDAVLRTHRPLIRQAGATRDTPRSDLCLDLVSNARIHIPDLVTHDRKLRRWHAPSTSREPYGVLWGPMGRYGAVPSDQDKSRHDETPQPLTRPGGWPTREQVDMNDCTDPKRSGMTLGVYRVVPDHVRYAAPSWGEAS
jgi:hypothetical protein